MYRAPQRGQPAREQSRCKTQGPARGGEGGIGSDAAVRRANLEEDPKSSRTRRGRGQEGDSSKDDKPQRARQGCREFRDKEWEGGEEMFLSGNLMHQLKTELILQKAPEAEAPTTEEGSQCFGTFLNFRDKRAFWLPLQREQCKQPPQHPYLSRTHLRMRSQCKQ